MSIIGGCPTYDLVVSILLSKNSKVSQRFRGARGESYAVRVILPVKIWLRQYSALVPLNLLRTPRAAVLSYQLEWRRALEMRTRVITKYFCRSLTSAP